MKYGMLNGMAIKRPVSFRNEDGEHTGVTAQSVETAIESNPEQAAQQLPQGSPIQQEAVQATQNGPQAEVNNKVVDDYVNYINKQFGEGIKYLKPNYETLKNMPSFDFNKPETLTNSDWWKEQEARNWMYDSPSTQNIINQQPGFDYDIDAIKADYPEAYYNGDSPADQELKSRKAIAKDFEETGDTDLIEEYIKETGGVPWWTGNGYGKTDLEMWKAMRNRYPQFFDKYPLMGGDVDGLTKYLRNRDENNRSEDPTTLMMNLGLSEDDPDYFGSYERIKKPIAKTGRRINA